MPFPPPRTHCPLSIVPSRSAAPQATVSALAALPPVSQAAGSHAASAHRHCACRRRTPPLRTPPPHTLPHPLQPRTPYPPVSPLACLTRTAFTTHLCRPPLSVFVSVAVKDADATWTCPSCMCERAPHLSADDHASR